MRANNAGTSFADHKFLPVPITCAATHCARAVGSEGLDSCHRNSIAAIRPTQATVHPTATTVVGVCQEQLLKEKTLYLKGVLYSITHTCPLHHQIRPDAPVRRNHVPMIPDPDTLRRQEIATPQQ